MADFHQLSPTVHIGRSQAFTFNQSSYYPPQPPVSPLALYDAHEMADMIQRTIKQINPTVAADIAAHMETTSMSGQDFLGLSFTGLQKLSKNNEQVSQELKKLRDIPPTTLLTRSPSIKKRFPELEPLIHSRRHPTVPGSPSNGANSMTIVNMMVHLNNDSGSSAMFSSQVPQESFNYEAFDYSDEEEEATPDTAATANETPLPQVSALQDHLGLPDHPLQDTSVNPATEDGPPLASPIFSNLEDETPVLGEDPSGGANISDAGLISHNSPQNDLTISAVTSLPDTDIPTATTPARDGATRVHSAEEAYNAEIQPIGDQPITSTTIFCASEASIHGLDEPEPVNPLDSYSASGLEGDITLLQDDSADPDLSAYYTPDARSPSPTLSYVDEGDPGAAIQHSEIPSDGNVNPSTPLDPTMPSEEDRLPIITSHSSLTTEESTSDSLEGFQLENSLALSFDHPQTLIDSQGPITDDEEALNPRSPPATEPAATFPASPSTSSSLGYLMLNLPPLSEFPLLLDLELYNPISDTRSNVGQANNDQPPETSQSPDASQGTVDCAAHEIEDLNVHPEDPRDSLILNGAIESYRSSPQLSSPSSTSLLEPTSVSVTADVQSATAPADETVEDPVVEDLSPPCSSNPARLGVHHGLNSDALPQLDLQCLQDADDLDERSTVDTNIFATSPYGSDITFTLPLIPATPSDSPMFEGLSKYMTLHDWDAPGFVSQENPRVDLDEVSTPVQHEGSDIESTLWSPSTSGSSQSLSSGYSESEPASNSFELSAELNSTQGSDVDSAVQPDPPCPHLLSPVPIRDSYLGGGLSPLQRIQSGLLNVIPTFFALDREKINRATSCSATSPRL
ncbi:hypothetical protein BYT27DRAFT_7239403 [Phlegmacium glaucopus]|nr:hypothetical protein BYT27DRAFT_7239403 [Phlegmacium glaucopus]